MATNNSNNQQFTNNADGFDLSGGTTKRKLTVTGADVSLTGSGSNTYTLPAATDTLVGRASTDTLTNKDLSSTTNIFPSGTCVQAVSANFSAVATGTTLMPYDDTIPQITEGNEYMTLTITPKSSTNLLVIEAVVMMSSSAANQEFTVALFQDTTTNALAANGCFQLTGTANMDIPLRHSITAGTTSATTFRVRAGCNNAGTTTFNGQSGARRYGGITVSNITIREYKA